MWSYIGGDIALHLVQKLAQRDFIITVPMSTLGASIALSVFVRIAGKVVADFSGMLITRSPGAFSGGFYSLNQVAVQIGVLVSVWLYNEHAEEVEGKLDRDTPWGVAVAVASLCTVLNSYFIGRVMAPKLRSTFWSFESGWQLLERQFFECEGDDRARVHVFNNNIFAWKGIENERESRNGRCSLKTLIRELTQTERLQRETSFELEPGIN